MLIDWLKMSQKGMQMRSAHSWISLTDDLTFFDFSKVKELEIWVTYGIIALLICHCRTSRFRKSFFPSAINGWNSLDLDLRNSVSLPIFKAKLRSILFPYCYNKSFDFSFFRRASIHHTRLRLGFSCLREYLCKINRCASPFASAALILNR